MDETADLEERTEKLDAFMHGEDFSKISLAQQSYLGAQLPLMQKLLDVLKARAEALVVEEDAKQVKEESLKDRPAVEEVAAAPITDVDHPDYDPKLDPNSSEYVDPNA
jgi:hypothetical protein